MNVEFDQEHVTFLLDSGEQEVFTQQEYCEAILWLLRRQNDLRYQLHKLIPAENIRQPMRLINGYVRGRLADRRLVCIKQEVYEQALQEAERVTRINWAFDVNDKRNLERGPVHLVQYDKDGKEIPYLPVEKVTPEDCPAFLIQEVIYKRMQPEYWVDKNDNLDLGKYDRWP